MNKPLLRHASERNPNEHGLSPDPSPSMLHGDGAITDNANLLVVSDGTTSADVRYDTIWLHSLLRPLLIVTLVCCLNVALTSFLHYAVPDIPANYLSVLLVLGAAAALLGCFTTSWLEQPEQRAHRSERYRFSELVLLLAVTRGTIWLIGPWPTLNTLLATPLEALFDLWFIGGAIVVVLCWNLATEMTSTLLSLALQPDEVFALEVEQRHVDSLRSARTERRSHLEHFTNLWIGGGVLLILLAAATRIAPAEQGFFALVRQRIDPAVLTSSVVYFIVGLLLVSQGQLALLRARWTIERVPNAPAIVRGWSLYTFLVLAVAGAIAALLPFGGTFLLARILYAILNALYVFVQLLVQFFMLLLSLLFSPLTGNAAPTPTPEPTPLLEATVTPAPPSSAPFLPEWTGSALFWVTMGIFLLYATVVYMRSNNLRWAWVTRLWQLLSERWRQLRQSVQSLNLGAAAADEQTEQLEGAAVRRPLSWWQRRTLSPAERARYYYLLMLERAAAVDAARHTGETPNRYAQRMSETLTARALEQQMSLHKARSDEGEHEASRRLDGGELEGRELDHENKAAHSTDPTAQFEMQRLQDEALQQKRIVQELTDTFQDVKYANRKLDNASALRLDALWRSIQRWLKD